jgi:type IX secretion system PorP/SprF family membrane protein
LRRFLFIKIFVFLLFCGAVHKGVSQQLPIFSLYRDNGFVLNPSLVGSKKSAYITATGRKQWTNIDKAPHTESLSFDAPFQEKDIGLGGFVMNDQTGPTSFTTAYVSYAYHLEFKKVDPFQFSDFLRYSTISVGISASLSQYRLRADELVLEEPNDQAIIDSRSSTFLPNAGLGIHYRYRNYSLGFSVPRIVELTSRFQEEGRTTTLQKVNHYYTTIGATYSFIRTWEVEPLIWFRAVPNAPLQADMNVRVTWEDILWAGIGYRTTRIGFADVGVILKDHWHLGYAIDFPLSPEYPKLGTSHEIVLRYRFPKSDERSR